MKTLDSLPSEIVLEIFSFAEPEDKARLLRVCKRFYVILQSSRLVSPFTVPDAKDVFADRTPLQNGTSIYRASYTQTFNNGSWLNSVISIELWYIKTRYHETTKVIPSLISIFREFVNLNKLGIILKGVTCLPEDLDDSSQLNNLFHLEMELEGARNSKLTPLSSFLKHCPEVRYVSALNTNAYDTDEIVKTIPSLINLETLNIKQRIPGPSLHIANLIHLRNLIVYQIPSEEAVVDNNIREVSTSDGEPIKQDSYQLEFLFYSFGRGPNGFFDFFSHFLKSENVGSNLKVLLFESDEMFFGQVSFETIIDTCPVLETLMLSSRRSDLVGKMLHYAAGTSTTLSTLAVGPCCPWTMLVKDLFEIRTKNSSNVRDDSAIIYGRSKELSVYLYWYKLTEDILPHLREEGIELEYKLVEDRTIKDKLFGICDEINCLE